MPFRNTIVVDKSGIGDDLPIRLFSPREVNNTWHLAVNASNLPHHNFIHYRNIENLIEEELPAPPTQTGFRLRSLKWGGYIGHTLRGRYSKELLERQKERIGEDTVKEKHPNTCE